MKELANKSQRLFLVGVLEHHHNGVVEASIETVVYKARSMVIHVALCWTEVCTKYLCPFALNCDICLHNITPRQDNGKSPD